MKESEHITSVFRLQHQLSDKPLTLVRMELLRDVVWTDVIVFRVGTPEDVPEEDEEWDNVTVFLHNDQEIGLTSSILEQWSFARCVQNEILFAHEKGCKVWFAV